MAIVRRIFTSIYFLDFVAIFVLFELLARSLLRGT